MSNLSNNTKHMSSNYNALQSMSSNYNIHQHKVSTHTFIELLHHSFEDEQTRCMAIAAEVFHFWQMAGKAMSPQPPGILLVNSTGTTPDPVERILERTRGLHTPEPPSDEESKFKLSTELSRHWLPRLMEEANGLNPEMKNVHLMTYQTIWDDAKKRLFGSGRVGYYAKMWDDQLGLITDKQDDIILCLDRPEDYFQFREDVATAPEKILTPVGVGSQFTMVKKVAAVSGSLNRGEWDDSLVSGIVNQGLPILFLPHSASKPWRLEQSLDLTLVGQDFANTWNPLRDNQIVADLSMPPNRVLLTYERIIRARLRHMPGGYEYFILRTIRELKDVCARVARFLVEGKVPEAVITTLFIDLFFVTLRGIIISIESLAFHGFGFDAVGWSQPQVAKFLEFIREKGEVSRREIQRRFQNFDATERNEVLDILEEQGLLKLDKANVCAVNLDDFVKGISERVGLAPLNLSTKPLAENLEAAGYLLN